MPLSSIQKPNLDSMSPETHGKISTQSAKLHGVTVTRVTVNPGGSWSNDLKAASGTSSCQKGHVGLVLGGKMAARMDDGAEESFSQNDVANGAAGASVGAPPYT